MVLANPVVALEMQVAYVDLAHAFFFVAAFVFMSRALDDPQSEARWLLLSGISAGLLAGTKITGGVGAAIIGALYVPRLIAAVRSGGTMRALRALLARFVLHTVALAAPWLVKSATYTGNPVYPLLYRQFGGPDWSPALSEQFLAWHRSIGMGREIVDFLLLPLRVILAGGPGYASFDGKLGVFWIVMLPVALWGAWRHGRPGAPSARARSTSSSGACPRSRCGS
jgi:hypothetical protein